MIGLALLFTFKAIDSRSSSGNLYAKITYENELILMIDLETLDYKVYDTIYKDQVITDLSSEGIFYVPGKVTVDMEDLYRVDQFAKDNQITGIKLLVEEQKISVLYQESPKDICALQAPTNSHLKPIVCLPNELVIDVFSNLPSEQFVPDSILE